MRSECQILADAFENAQQMTRWFLSKVPDERFTERPEANGHRFNSAHWIQAHLVWSEAFLLLQSLGAKMPDIPWLDQFALGSKPNDVTVVLSRDDLKAAGKTVHQAAMEHLRGMDDADLEKPSDFPMFKTWRGNIHHAIRHEGNHGGQLSWLIKMQKGEATI
jgi:hypothetical protein